MQSTHFARTRQFLRIEPGHRLYALTIFYSVGIATGLSQTHLAPVFEVASIRRIAPDELSMPFPDGSLDQQIRIRGGPGTQSPNRFDCYGGTLKMLLMRAFNIQANQISGPNWLENERYNVSAKINPGSSTEQFRLMLQGFLLERFQMQVHHDFKRLPVYNLVIAKTGSKVSQAERLPEAKDEAARKGIMQNKAAESLNFHKQNMIYRRSFFLPNATVEEFAAKLSTFLDRPLMEKTHIDGRHAFSLKWSPEGTQTEANGLRGPSIFAAVEEQLGLKLERGTAEVETLVIDVINKTPSVD